VSRCLLLIVWCGVAGCAFDRSGIGGDDVPIDGPPGNGDAVDPIDGGDDLDGTTACITWPALNVDPCDPLLPEPDTLNLASGQFTYNTDTGVLTEGGVDTTPASAVLSQTDGPDVRVLNTVSFNIDSVGTLAVSGSRPLIIVVHGNASIAGTIDVSARVRGLDNSSTPGPGGNDPTECADGTKAPGGPSTNVSAGGGGGGGGGYGADGGDGTDGNGGGHGGKGPKGSSNGVPEIEPLRGGCAGSAGGDDADGIVDTSGRAGDGGGALEITARATVSISGVIRAGGRGGAAALPSIAGGGGGGSGGAILVDGETASVEVTAMLCANGGGGGEGGQLAQASDDGENATCSETVEAQGGESSLDGGDGGDGGAASDLTGDNASGAGNGGGGGGGGGGVGRIRIRGRTTRDVDPGAVVSPNSTS
jgi:hypothetical protein